MDVTTSTGFQEGRRLVVDGVGLEMRWWGARADAGLTLVLLHEGLGCVALWRDFPERLTRATGLPVFAYSRAGYGSSDPVRLPRPLRYMHDEARRLPAVLDAAGIGRCILIGHSDGASIAALAAATTHDPRLAGLVLIAPHYFAEDMALTAIRGARDAYAAKLRPRLAEFHRDVDGAFHGWNGAWLDPRFRAWNLLAEIHRISVPALQIQGIDDPYGTTAQTAAGEAAGMTTCLLKARHAPQFEEPEATLAAITGFLSNAIAI